MSNSLNGVQLNSRAGLDMRTQYSEINNLPNPDSPQANTLSNNPIYNMLQVLFDGTNTESMPHNTPENAVIGSDGLKKNFVNTDPAVAQKLNLSA